MSPRGRQECLPHQINMAGVLQQRTATCYARTGMQPRIMYIECKSTNNAPYGLRGPARIGRVSFSKTGKRLYYGGKKFQTLRGFGYKSNYFDIDSGEHYWISGCKKRGGDRLYPGLIEIDDDVREEYWSEIRKKPECNGQKVIRCSGKYAV